MYIATKTKLSLALFAISGLLGISAQADSISLRNGDINPITNQVYTGQSNNSLILSGGLVNNNYGRLNAIIGSTDPTPRGTIMQFDLSSLTGTVNNVTGATLSLTPATVSPISFDFSVYLIVPENAGWKAGYSNGSSIAIQTGDSAAAFKAKGSGDASTNTKWHSGGNWGAGDYVATAIATGTYLHTSADNADVIALNLPAEIIQSWIDNPSANAGIWIVANAQLPTGGVNSTGFYSGNLGTSQAAIDLRPMLNIEYQIPEPGTVSLALGGIALAAAFVWKRRRSAV